MTIRLSLLLVGVALVLLAWSWQAGSRRLPAPAFASSSSAMLVVVRDAQEPAGTLPHTILLDGKPIARLRPGDMLRMPVSIGSHGIILACDEPPTSAGGYEVPVTFRAGETLSFRSRTISDQVCLLSVNREPAR